MRVFNRTKGYTVEVQEDLPLDVQILTKVKRTKHCLFCDSTLPYSVKDCPICHTRLTKRSFSPFSASHKQTPRIKSTIHDRPPNTVLEQRLVKSVRHFLEKREREYTKFQNEYTSHLVKKDSGDDVIVL